MVTAKGEGFPWHARAPNHAHVVSLSVACEAGSCRKCLTLPSVSLMLLS